MINILSMNITQVFMNFFKYNSIKANQVEKSSLTSSNAAIVIKSGEEFWSIIW